MLRARVCCARASACAPCAECMAFLLTTGHLTRQVEMYARGVGLGAGGASAPPDPSVSYADAVRRAARARYEDRT